MARVQQNGRDIVADGKADARKPTSPPELSIPEGSGLDQLTRPTVFELEAISQDANKRAATPGKTATDQDVKSERSASRATVSKQRRIHILYGDEDRRGGGHLHGVGIPDKTEFPASWSEDRIIDEIESVANDPTSSRRTGRRQRTIIEGTRDGVDIRLLIEPDGTTIVTGHPTNLQANPPKGPK